MHEIRKGGRGRRAPYDTELLRIPKPLKDALSKICNRYREKILEYYDPCEPQLIDSAIQGQGYGDGMISEINTRLEELQRENEELHSKLSALSAESFILRDIQHKQREILSQSLKLRANAGGAIKEEIKKAIALGDEVKQLPQE